MANNDTPYDVIIAGGGPPGLALAAILGRGGMRACIIDPGPPPPKPDNIPADTRTAALMGGSTDVLARAGIWPRTQKHGSPLKRMAVVDDSRFPAEPDAMVEQMFDAQELGRDAFGWNLPLAALRAELGAVLAGLDTVTFLHGTKLQSFDVGKDGVTVNTGDATLKAKLLVGCDGRNSAVREGAGLATARHAYGQMAMTCLIDHTRPHDDTSVEFHRPGGPFTIVPMQGNRSQGNRSAIVWVEKDDVAKDLLRLPRPAFEKALDDRTRNRVGRVTLQSDPVSWPLEFLRAPVLVAPRVALAAEAAHVISPIGAQGLNLSLRDVNDLADIVLESHALGLDIGAPSVLARYARARKGDVATRSFAIDAANRLVADDRGLVRALRRLTLRALSLPGPLRHLVMKKGLAA